MKPAPFEYRRAPKPNQSYALLFTQTGGRLIFGARPLPPIVARRSPRAPPRRALSRASPLPLLRRAHDHAAVGVGFPEISARRSVFALVSAAAQAARAEDGTCGRLALGIGGAGDIPIAFEEAAEQLRGTSLGDTEVNGVVTDAMADVET